MIRMRGRHCVRRRIIGQSLGFAYGATPGVGRNMVIVVIAAIDFSSENRNHEYAHNE